MHVNGRMAGSRAEIPSEPLGEGLYSQKWPSGHLPPTASALGWPAAGGPTVQWAPLGLQPGWLIQGMDAAPAAALAWPATRQLVPAMFLCLLHQQPRCAASAPRLADPVLYPACYAACLLQPVRPDVKPGITQQKTNSAFALEWV